LGSPVSSTPQGYRQCQVFCDCLSIAESEQIQARRLGRSIPVPGRGAVVLQHIGANRFGLSSAQLRLHVILCRGPSRPHSLRHAPSSALPFNSWCEPQALSWWVQSRSDVAWGFIFVGALQHRFRQGGHFAVSILSFVFSGKFLRSFDSFLMLRL